MPFVIGRRNAPPFGRRRNDRFIDFIARQAIARGYAPVMGYWQSVQSAAGMGGSYQWVLAGCAAAALVLAAVAPDARTRLRGVVLLLGLSFAGILLSAL